MAPFTGAGDAPRFELDLDTLISLAIAFCLMPAAQTLAKLSLPEGTPTKYTVLFIWHAYDCLTHFILEASYLYHCFFSYTQLPAPTEDFPHPASRSGPSPPVLYNRADRQYGPFYGHGPMARLWQEYAKADKRWGGADLNVISLEILTCFLMAPLAVLVCYDISRAMNAADEQSKNAAKARIWLTAIFIATSELYGGFMTFAPEWLSGNTMLTTDDPVFFWLHLVFFNTIWVYVPLWVLFEGYKEIYAAFTSSATVAKKTS
ncbi:hypothetical protein DV737_g2196, partial [Chaetothyriales sp. CBS 132003]